MAAAEGSRSNSIMAKSLMAVVLVAHRALGSCSALSGEAILTVMSGPGAIRPSCTMRLAPRC
jgi:hypothetical protein